MKNNATEVQCSQEVNVPTFSILALDRAEWSPSCYRKSICYVLYGLTVILNVVTKWRNCNNSKSNIPPVQPITRHCTVLTPCSYSEKWKCKTLPFLYFRSVPQPELVQEANNLTNIPRRWKEWLRLDYFFLISLFFLCFFLYPSSASYRGCYFRGHILPWPHVMHIDSDWPLQYSFNYITCKLVAVLSKFLK